MRISVAFPSAILICPFISDTRARRSIVAPQRVVAPRNVKDHRERGSSSGKLETGDDNAVCALLCKRARPISMHFEPFLPIPFPWKETLFLFERRLS